MPASKYKELDKSHVEAALAQPRRSQLAALTGRKLQVAPLHEHRDTATICSFYNSELLVDQLPVTLVELGAIHAGCRLCGVAPDWFFLLLATAIGSCTQVIHKHSHLRGHVDGHYGDSKRPKARVDAVAKAIFFLQDLRILMPHETHRIHHAKGINPCLTSGWCNWLINPLVIQDDAYDEIPTLRLDQPIYDIPEVEQTRKDRLAEMYGEGAVGRE